MWGWRTRLAPASVVEDEYSCGRAQCLVQHTDWLLTQSERGNARTVLDDRHDGEIAWSTGNVVRPLIHGATYFAELYERLQETEEGDLGG